MTWVFEPSPLFLWLLPRGPTLVLMLLHPLSQLRSILMFLAFLPTTQTLRASCGSALWRNSPTFAGCHQMWSQVTWHWGRPQASSPEPQKWRWDGTASKADCTCDFVSWKQTFLLKVWKCQLWALGRTPGFPVRSFWFVFFLSKCDLPSWMKSYFSCCLM